MFKCKLRGLLKSWLAVAVAFSLVLLIALPIVVALPGAMAQGSFWLYEHGYLIRSAMTTMFLMAAAGLASYWIGSTTAWIVSCYDFWGRKWVRYMLVLPLAVPIYVGGYVYYQYLSSPKWLYVAAERLALPRSGVSYTYNMVCAALIMALMYYPYVYLLTLSKLNKISDVIVVARTFGYRGIRLFTRVVLCSTRPALLLGTTLVIMEVITEYGMTNYYGLDTFVNMVYRLWFNAQDYYSASIVTAMALVFSIAIFLLGHYIRRNSHDNFANYEAQPHLIKVNGARGMGLFLYCFNFACLGFFLPVTQLAMWSYRSLRLDTASVHALLRNAWHSISLAVIVSIAAIMISLVVNYIMNSCRNRLISWASNIVLLGYAVPGSIVATNILSIGMANSQSSAYHLVSWLWSAGILCLIYAYLYRFLGIAHKVIGVSFGQITNDIGHTMAVYYGHMGWLQKLRECSPLILSNASVAFALVFIDMMKELPITLILRPFNYDTLATSTYELISDERYRDASTASIAIIIVSLTMLWAIFRQIPKQPGERRCDA